MIGSLSAHAGTFATVICSTIIVVFGVPITFFTLRWSRLMGWTLPEHTHLALYFGRCTGLLALCVCSFGLWCVQHPVHLPAFYGVFGLAMASMLILHVVGAALRQQPISETLEIGLWLLLLTATLACWPSGT